jgi:hypothetical protein
MTNNNCIENILNSSDICFIKSKYVEKFIKSKDGINKKNYPIRNKDNQKITLSLKGVIIPFGSEKFNNQYIVNIELPNRINEHYNTYVEIYNFETDLEQKKINDKDILKDIEGKTYHANIRDSLKGRIIRTYLHGNPEIYSIIGNKKFLMTSSELKKTFCDIELYLGIFWITQEEYGILWYIDNIKIIHNI